MYEQTNTMMETKTSFQIPQLLDGDDFTSEDLADDMEGLRLSFTRIKIPGGGHLQFEIPSGNPDVPDYAPYLEGVILYSHNSNAYWPEVASTMMTSRPCASPLMERSATVSPAAPARTAFSTSSAAMGTTRGRRART